MPRKSRRNAKRSKPLDPRAILARTTAFYLESSDFNGLPVRQLMLETCKALRSLSPILQELVADEQITIVFGDGHPNPHIKALPDNPIERQIETLRRVKEPNYCLYPSPAVLEGAVDRTRFADRPFTLMLALGEPQLKFLAFDL